MRLARVRVRYVAAPGLEQMVATLGKPSVYPIGTRDGRAAGLLGGNPEMLGNLSRLPGWVGNEAIVPADKAGKMANGSYTLFAGNNAPATRAETKMLRGG